ncbi:MAG: hypothetical protein Q9M92_14690 [Enterobacterales bacterium]|nr:hypothetical protein [Enterobacterales bacterium]
MKKMMVSLLCILAISALSPPSIPMFGIAYASVDPVPGIDIIVERDPEDNSISVGGCWREGKLLVKSNQGQWKCVSKAWAKKKFAGNKAYSKKEVDKLQNNKCGSTHGQHNRGPRG